MLSDIKGFVNIDETDDCTFNRRSSYNAKLIVYLKEIIYNGYECIGYDKEYSNSTYLKKGIISYNLVVYVG